MNDRMKYIAELEEENQRLRGEMYEAIPNSAIWLGLKSQIKANNEEIEIMQEIIETMKVRAMGIEKK